MTDTPPNVKLLTPPTSNGQVAAWLSKNSGAGLPFLLALAEDGVLWGKWDGGLKLANEFFAGSSIQLRGETLQQAYLFGEKGQIHLFRDGISWKASQITDVARQDMIREFQILWGDEASKSISGFTPIRDKKQQGMDQIVPVEVTQADFDVGKVVRLELRHYVTYEETGEARIFLSRLVRVGLGPVAEEKIQ